MQLPMPRYRPRVRQPPVLSMRVEKRLRRPEKRCSGLSSPNVARRHSGRRALSLADAAFFV
jgi:hypothetical protein